MKENVELFGDRVVIQLDKAPEVSTNEFGIHEALMENYETDGGKIGSKVSTRSFLNKGTVVQISPYSARKLEEMGASLQEGDKVLVTYNATNEQYNFSYSRNGLVKGFSGLVSIPHVLIEGKFLNGTV